MTEPFEREDGSELEERVKERRAVNHVRNFMFASEQYRRPHLQMSKEDRDLYETWQPQGRSRIGRANLKPPYLFTVI